MGTANETVAVTDVASQAPNMMNFVGNLKAASQASDELTARSPLRVQCFAHERCFTLTCRHEQQPRMAYILTDIHRDSRVDLGVWLEGVGTAWRYAWTQPT
jgi:hypothetical protein